MRTSRAAILGAAASVALAGGIGAAYAQSQVAEQGRVIQVPPGAVMIVLPGGAMPMAPFSAASTAPMTLAGPMMAGTGSPFAAMPDAAAMMGQANQMLDQMMEAAHHGFAQPAWAHPAWIGPGGTIEAAMPGMPRLGGAVRGVVVIVQRRPWHVHAARDLRGQWRGAEGRGPLDRQRLRGRGRADGVA